MSLVKSSGMDKERTNTLCLVVASHSSSSLSSSMTKAIFGSVSCKCSIYDFMASREYVALLARVFCLMDCVDVPFVIWRRNSQNQWSQTPGKKEMRGSVACFTIK